MLSINFTKNDFAVDDFANSHWKIANSAAINKYWSGERAPATRHSVARVLWSDDYLYVRFDSVQQEPLVVSKTPDTTKKTVGLWERDVCEFFVAPDLDEPTRYFEFEVAPTGEWIDLGITKAQGDRHTDLEYVSKMEAAAKSFGDRIVSGIKIPWGAFNRKPKEGEIWKGNLFRVIGENESRGYLTWKPTQTEVPDFHVPEKFGELKFAT